MSLQLQLFANNATTTLAIPAGLTDGTITVTNGSNFPSPTGSQYFLVTLESSGIIEVVRAISRTGNTFTLVDGISGTGTSTADGVHGRGQEGTAANTFPAGTIVECRVTKNTLGSLLPISSYFPYLATTSLSAPSLMTGTAYVAGSDDGGAGVISVAMSTTEWSFPSMSVAYIGNATSGSTTSITAASLPTSGVSGKYIIQFTSGSNQGYVRPITTYGSGTVSWSDALPYAITTDGYKIYQSNYSIISSLVGGNSTDEALVYAIAFGA